jgi:hypothetical protein
LEKSAQRPHHEVNAAIIRVSPPGLEELQPFFDEVLQIVAKVNRLVVVEELEDGEADDLEEPGVTVWSEQVEDKCLSLGWGRSGKSFQSEAGIDECVESRCLCFDVFVNDGHDTGGQVEGSRSDPDAKKVYVYPVAVRLNVADDGCELAGREELSEFFVQTVVQRVVLEFASEWQLSLSLEQLRKNRAFVFGVVALLVESARQVVFNKDVERVKVREAATGLGAATRCPRLQVDVLQQQAAFKNLICLPAKAAAEHTLDGFRKSVLHVSLLQHHGGLFGLTVSPLVGFQRLN